jgi:hypothetical protein
MDNQLFTEQYIWVGHQNVSTFGPSDTDILRKTIEHRELLRILHSAVYGSRYFDDPNLTGIHAPGPTQDFSQPGPV